MPGKRIEMRQIREILRLSLGCGLSGRRVGQSLGVGKSVVLDYVRRARAAGLSWPLPSELDSDAALDALLLPRQGRPRETAVQPDWGHVGRELKRPGVTLSLLWLEYRQIEPQGYSYSRFCELYGSWRKTAGATFRNRHRAGEVVQSDYAGQRVLVFDPALGRLREAQIFVATLGASSYTYAEATWTQGLPDWIGSHTRAFGFFGGVAKAIVCDNLKSGVTKPLWFEPTVNRTFEDMAVHYDTVVLPARVRKPRDKAKAENAVQVVQRWVLARLRNRQFFSLAALNAEITALVHELNDRPMRHVGKSRRELFEELERPALKALPQAPYQYAEWKQAKVHPDYHVEVDRNFYSVPHQLIGREVEVRLTLKVVEVFHDHRRIASHIRRSQRVGHVTVPEHMPKAHQRYANTTPRSLIRRAAEIGFNTAILVERLMRDRPHPEQGFRAAMGILSLKRRFGPDRLEAACTRALEIQAVSYSSVNSILKTGLDQAPDQQEPPKATAAHGNIRGSTYYH